MNKPLIAAILNIYPGLGYLFLDIRNFVAWLIYGSFTFAAISMFSSFTSPGASATSSYTLGHWIWLTMLLLLWGALIIDAYHVASKRETTKLIRQKSVAMAAGQFLGRAAVIYF